MRSSRKYSDCRSAHRTCSGIREWQTFSLETQQPILCNNGLPYLTHNALSVKANHLASRFESSFGLWLSGSNPRRKSQCAHNRLATFRESHQGAHEEVDRQMSRFLASRGQREGACRDCYERARRNHIHTIRLQPGPCLTSSTGIRVVFERISANRL
jgi:hypothetical protein